MNRKAEILSVLERGPATSRDVADELGIPHKLASAYLGNLRFAGAVRVMQKLATGCKGRPPNLYAI